MAIVQLLRESVNRNCHSTAFGQILRQRTRGRSFRSSFNPFRNQAGFIRGATEKKYSRVPDLEFPGKRVKKRKTPITGTMTVMKLLKLPGSAVKNPSENVCS